MRKRVCPAMRKVPVNRRTLTTVDIEITEDSVVPPPSSPASARRKMGRAISRRLSGKAVSSGEDGSALVEEDSAAAGVVMEDLPLGKTVSDLLTVERRSLATTDVSVRTSGGTGGTEDEMPDA